MKTIKLTQNKVTLIDDEDFERVSQHNWYAHISKDNWRAEREEKINGRKKILIMSRFIMNVVNSKMLVDHKNHNTLDNQKSNLRICTNSENCQNRRKRENNRSGFKGVSWSKIAKRWRAQIKTNGKGIHLGYFNDPELAHKAYCKAAIKYHGEFAHF